MTIRGLYANGVYFQFNIGKRQSIHVAEAVERQNSLEALLENCRLDTLAMVSIWRALGEIAETSYPSPRFGIRTVRSDRSISLFGKTAKIEY